MRLPLRPAWLVLCACVLLGCAKKVETTPAQAVESFFDAVTQGDCVAALKWVDGPVAEKLRETPCEEMLALFRQKPFEAILGTKEDGRDSTATLVRVRFTGEKEPATIRVQKQRGTHKIVSL